jgi:hypothetical protein
MTDREKGLIAKLSELREGLRRNDPVFCGTAPPLIVETILRNLEEAMTRPHEAGWLRGVAISGIRFAADHDARGCEALLERLSELLSGEGVESR